MSDITIPQETVNKMSENMAKVKKEAASLRGRLPENAYNSGGHFLSAARGLSQEEIKTYGLNVKRLLDAIDAMLTPAPEMVSQAAAVQAPVNEAPKIEETPVG